MQVKACTLASDRLRGTIQTTNTTYRVNSEVSNKFSSPPFVIALVSN